MVKNISIIVLLLIASRFIGLPANFSPLLALAVYIPRVTNQRVIQCLLPVGILLGTNFFLEPVNYITLISMALVFVAAPLITIAIKNLLHSCICTILFWHILVNGSVWLINGGSIIETYVMAIEFDFRLLMSTLVFVSIFYIFEKIALIIFNHLKYEGVIK